MYVGERGGGRRRGRGGGRFENSYTYETMNEWLKTKHSLCLIGLQQMLHRSAMCEAGPEASWKLKEKQPHEYLGQNSIHVHCTCR